MLNFYELLQPFFEVPTYHLVLESILVLWVLSLLLKKSYNPKTLAPLTEKEKDDLIAEWIPDPLVPEDADQRPIKYEIVEGKAGKYMNIGGRELLNLATCDYLATVDDERVEAAAAECLRKYGVGSCGPRAFFGTIDVHLDMEKRISEFMGTEQSCLYSLGFSTIASAIPAYAKRSDIIFADEAVCFPIQKGLQASRSRIVYFRHNDSAHLHELLQKQHDYDKKHRKKAAVVRKFLVVEGIYANTGEVCSLPALVRLKHQYKLRLFVEESHSFGVLGARGRGVVEHFDLSMEKDIDLVAASMEVALGSTGGFTTGSMFVVEHQRLSSSGYVFSAALAPLCAAAAKKVIDLLDQDNSMLDQLQAVCKRMHSALSSITGLRLGGDEISPLKFLYLSQPSGDRNEDLHVLEKIVHACREEGFALVVARYLEDQEHLLPEPSIRLTCNRQLSDSNIDGVKTALANAVARFV